jgi:hypothetical protein
VVDYKALTGLSLLRYHNNPYSRGHRMHRQCPRHLIDGYVYDLPLPSQEDGLRGVCTVATLDPTAYMRGGGGGEEGGRGGGGEKGTKLGPPVEVTQPPPPNTGPYIQQDNIRFYHTICKCTNNIREVIE